MLKMFLSKRLQLLSNQRGVGLITAIFLVVIVGMFGTLVARYLTVSSVTSAEDYHWAQALYSAQSGVQIEILYNDNGGSGGQNLTEVAGFTLNVSTSGNVVNATARKERDTGAIYREIEVRTSL